MDLPGHIISRFHVVGINHASADAAIRGLFAVNDSAQEVILKQAKADGLRSIFILSTCNRTEVYGYCQHETDLINLLVNHTQGSHEVFGQCGFIKKSEAAVAHLFDVAAGLDSQIIGDYEILGQLKLAVNFARLHDMIGPIMDRTINFVQQASKSIKTHTQLSTGTVSVSYAAIEWLKTIDNIQSKNILLFGAGKLGRNVVKNIRHYLKPASITIINRTAEIAKKMALETGNQWQPIENLSGQVAQADIVVVCTNANAYTILPAFFTGKKQQWVLDLSVPVNVDPLVSELPNLVVCGVDEVSQIMQQTIKRRNTEIPAARAIINQYVEEFYNWLLMYRHVPMIKDMKDKLYALSSIHGCEMATDALSETANLDYKVNKAVSSLAAGLRVNKEKGCQYIHTIKEFLQPGQQNESTY